MTVSVPNTDWLTDGSEEGAGHVTEMGTSTPSDARVPVVPIEAARPESADTALGRSASARTGAITPKRRKRLSIVHHLKFGCGPNGPDAHREAVSKPVSLEFQNRSQNARSVVVRNCYGTAAISGLVPAASR